MFDFLRTRRSVPVSIITGFLGSGKTTVLNHLLGHASLADTAVIINEFGEVGIDHLVAEHVDEKMMILSSGCICCTVRGDILLSLRDLFARRARKEIPWFRRVVVETTGLADPAPVVHALVASEAARSRVHLDTIVTVVDSSMGQRTLERHPEAVKQAALADIILLSKPDLVADSAVERLQAELRAINPGAPQVRSEFGQVDTRLLFGRNALDPGKKRPDVEKWLGVEDASSHEGHHSHHTSSIHTWTLYRDKPLTEASFHQLCRTLSSVGGEDLLRVKGILHVAPNCPVLIHAVQHAFYPPRRLARWPSKDQRSRLVFITRNMSHSDLEFVARGFRRLEISMRDSA